MAPDLVSMSVRGNALRRWVNKRVIINKRHTEIERNKERKKRERDRERDRKK